MEPVPFCDSRLSAVVLRPVDMTTRWQLMLMLGVCGVLCMVAVAVYQCSQGVRFTIEKAVVSPAGLIDFKLRHTAYYSYWTYNVSRTQDGDSVEGSGLGSEGSSQTTFQTDDVSSVRFFVHTGDSFVVLPGAEKVLCQFSNRALSGAGFVGPSETVSYVVKVKD
jgi:hypothetical protein